MASTAPNLPRRERHLLGWPVAATAILVGVIGLYLLLGGAWLVALGGSPYYLIAGAVLLVVAWLLTHRRRSALWLYAALLAGTLAWALWEVGLDFWALAPRGDILAPLGVWFLLPAIWRDLNPRGR